MGYEVSGSDMVRSAAVRRLEGLGASVHVGHREENIRGAQCVVYSSAVSADNVELRAAEAAKIPIIPRAEMLAELMRMKYGVAIAGTHGKTTTTSLIASILGAAGMDPTVVTGGRLNSIGANARLGGGDLLVAEADESDGSFLRLSPAIAVVTSIDREHMNHYGSMEEVLEAYAGFMNKVPFYGCAILCLDHPAIQGLLPRVTRRVLTYGLATQADVRGSSIGQRGLETEFDLMLRGRRLGRLLLRMPGTYNVQNALAASAVALELGAGFREIREGLESFEGVERRFHLRGSACGVTVIDDYGHHPEEIKAVLGAARQCLQRRIVAVFQPHRYTRTRDLFGEFLTAFNDVDTLVVTDVYPAGEEPIEGATGLELMRAIEEHGHRDVTFVKRVEDVAPLVAGLVRRGDVVMTLGAGDVWKAGPALLELLGREEKETGLKVL